MKSAYPKIFEPITIKRTTIKNRIAMTPMGTNYGETSGEMSNRHMNYYSLRAKGGVGLIILENANIEYPVGSNGTSQIRIDHDSFMPRYYQLVENLHKNGATVAIQINHAVFFHGCHDFFFCHRARGFSAGFCRDVGRRNGFHTGSCGRCGSSGVVDLNCYGGTVFMKIFD